MTIFEIVWDIHPGIISVKFCAILPQAIWVIEIFLLLWMFIILEIINTKTLKFNNKFAYLEDILMSGVMFLMIKKYDFWKLTLL